MSIGFLFYRRFDVQIIFQCHSSHLVLICMYKLDRQRLAVSCGYMLQVWSWVLPQLMSCSFLCSHTQNQANPTDIISVPFCSMSCLSVQVIISNDEACSTFLPINALNLSLSGVLHGPLSWVDSTALCHYLFRNLVALKRLLITRWDKLKVALFGCHRRPHSTHQLSRGNFLTLLLLFNIFPTKGGFGTAE